MMRAKQLLILVCMFVAAGLQGASVEQNVIRLEVDVGRFGESAVNLYTGQNPLMVRSRAHRFEIVVLKDGELDADVGNISSITLEVKTYQSPTSAPLISQSTSVIDTSVTDAERVNRNGQHAVIDLAEGQTGLDMTGADANGFKTFSLVITAVRNGKTVSLTFGAIQMLNDGGVYSGNTPTAGDPAYYTKAEVLGLLANFVKYGGNDPGRAIELWGTGGHKWRIGVNSDGERVDNVQGLVGNVSFTEALVTLTNLTGITNGATFDINGDVRRFTNGTPNPLTTWVHITNSLALQMTNLLVHLQRYAPSGPVETVTNGGTNVSFKMIGAPAQTLVVTPSAGWASVTYTTNTYTNTMAIRMPWTLETAASRSNLMWLLVEAINTYGTNLFNQNATALSGLVGTTNTQTISGKTLTSPTINGGTIAGSTIGGTVGVLSNGVIFYVVLSNVTVNATSGVMSGITISSGTLTGTIGALSGGNVHTTTISNTTVGSMKYLPFGTPWPTNFSTMFFYDRSTNLQSAIRPDTNGYPSLWLADNSGPWVDEGLFLPSLTNSPYALLSVYNAVLYFPTLHDYTALIGGAGRNTNLWTINNYYSGTNNRFGAPVFFEQGIVSYGNNESNSLISYSTMSNSVYKGSNTWLGDLAIPTLAVSSLADGTNTLGSITNIDVTLSGTMTADGYLAGWEGGRDGKWHDALNNTGFNLAILHNSGMESTATDRFWVAGLLRDVVVPNGGTFQVKYWTSIGKWVVRNVWPEDKGLTLTVTMTSDNWALSTTNVTHYRLKSNDATAANRTAVLSAGSYQGQLLSLETTDVSNAWELVDDAAVTGGGAVRLNSTFSSTTYDYLQLEWRETNWLERARSAN